MKPCNHEWVDNGAFLRCSECNLYVLSGKRSWPPKPDEQLYAHYDHVCQGAAPKDALYRKLKAEGAVDIKIVPFDDNGESYYHLFWKTPIQ